MKGPWWIYYWLLAFIIGWTSRGLHTLVFFGHPSRSLSARAHLEKKLRGKWTTRQRFINLMFFWQTDHCQREWKLEVERARETLALAEEINAIEYLERS